MGEFVGICKTALHRYLSATDLQRGRKPMPEETNKSRALHVRLPDRLTEPLDRATDRLTISQADFVRIALVEKLDRDGFMPREGSAA